jgi:uncharacterized protein (TIGR00290 family)
MPNLKVQGLHTTVDENTGLSGLHKIPSDLLIRQAKAIGLPLDIIKVGRNFPYEKQISNYYSSQKQKGCLSIAFGDIFLEDLKQYRSEILDKLGLSMELPLWKNNTLSLANEFIERGFKSIIVSADAHLLANACGKEFDLAFIQSLPSGIDPCGENGEFHTFCYDGPIFNEVVPFTKGEHHTEKFRFKTTEQGEIERSFNFLALS